MPAHGSKQLGNRTSAWTVKTKFPVWYIYCVGNKSVNIAVKILHVLSKLVTAFGVACVKNKWVKQVNFDGNRIALIITFIQIRIFDGSRVSFALLKERAILSTRDLHCYSLRSIFAYDNVTPEQNQVNCKNCIDLIWPSATRTPMCCGFDAPISLSCIKKYMSQDNRSYSL